MELKLFGKSLFSVNKNIGGVLVAQAMSGNNESKYLPDFYKSGNDLNDFIAFSPAITEIPKKETPKKEETNPQSRV